MANTSLSSGDQQKLQEIEAIRNKYQHAIDQMGQHVSVAPDHTFTLDIKSATEINVDQDAFNNLKQSLDHVNQLLRSGSHRIKDPQTKEVEPVGHASLWTQPNCAGQNGQLWYWWGVQDWFNECITQEIEGAFSSLSTLISGLQTWLKLDSNTALTVARYVFGVGSSVLSWIDGQGNKHGLIFYQTWYPSAAWLWHQ